MRVSILYCLYVLLALGIDAHAASDDCRAVLEQGIRNTNQKIRSGDLRSAFQHALCTNQIQSSSSKQGGGGGVSLPIKGIPFTGNANFSESAVRQIKNDSCSSSSSNFSDANYEALLQNTVDPQIVSAWAQCKRGGFYLNGELSGTTLVIESRFIPVLLTSEAQLTSDPVVTGAKCSNLSLKRGVVVRNVPIFDQCERVGNGPITITANTVQGGATLFIPAAQSERDTSSCEIFPKSSPPTCMCMVNDSESWSGPGRPICAAKETSGPCECATPEGIRKGTIKKRST